MKICLISCMVPWLFTGTVYYIHRYHVSHFTNWDCLYFRSYHKIGHINKLNTGAGVGGSCGKNSAHSYCQILHIRRWGWDVAGDFSWWCSPFLLSNSIYSNSHYKCNRNTVEYLHGCMCNLHRASSSNYIMNIDPSKINTELNISPSVFHISGLWLKYLSCNCWYSSNDISLKKNYNFYLSILNIWK